ncbi:MAG: hypothetical protein ACRC33_17090 [Gemmataceae bacterium]
MPGTIYLVQRWDWRVREDDTEEVPPGDVRTDVRPHPHELGVWERVTYYRGDDEGGVPVRAFSDRHAALAFARAEEHARRASTNPFCYGGGTAGRTSLDDGRLRDWLLDADLDPPGPEGEEDLPVIRATWQGWWGRVRPGLTEPQRKAAAQAMNNAQAGVGYGYPDAPGPDDLAWLDEQFGRVDGMSLPQRYTLRVGLIGARWEEYPDREGEHDACVVEPKWRDWWDRGHGAMSEVQRQKVWEALDRLRFYEVIELEA